MTEALRDLEAASPSTAIEPERYELLEPGRYRFDLDRRGFLRVLTAMGGGLLVVSTVPVAAQQETGRGGGQGAATDALAGWLHIGPDGRVTVYTGKVEIGQNIRTSLAQTVADELSAPMAAISLVMADTDLTPFDQGTFGSRTTPTMAPQLARAAATAREMLIDLAAAKWQVPRQSLAAKDGAVADASGRSISFGELTHGQNLTGVVSSQASEEPRDRWAVRGEPLHKVNARAIVTGTHAYPADVIRPGLLIGRVIRPPALGATVKAVDDSKARAMAGVMVVRDGEFIGVVAPNERAKAKRRPRRVAVEWNLKLDRPPRPRKRSSTTSARPLNPRRVAGAEATALMAPPAAVRAPRLARQPRRARPSRREPLTRRIAFRTSPTCRSSRGPRWQSGRATRSRSGRAASGPSACDRMSRARFTSPRIASA